MTGPSAGGAFIARSCSAGRLTVRPPWEPAGDTALDVVIDPGQAFGTGAHATTRLCLELLLESDARGSFADIGCGSGVLAIVAARLGFGPVLALDYDPLAVTATSENARRNGVELEAARLGPPDRPGARLRSVGGKRARRPAARLGRVPA